jgi:predicted TIM-barrel fold metal-dependent hydrolase
MTTMRWNSVEARAEVTSRVIDVHHHLGPKGRITGEDGKVDIASALAPHLEIMDRHGVDQAFLIASHNSLGRGPDGSERVNDLVAEAVRLEPGRFPVGLGTVDPVAGDGGIAEIDRCVRDLGLPGMAWHARYQGVFIDSPVMVRYMRHCVGLGVPIFIHVVAESKNEAIWRLAHVAEELPAGRFVALDAFSSHDQLEWLVEMGGRYPNVWYETGCLFTAGHPLPRFVARHGVSRLLFGSDFHAEGEHHLLPAALYEVLHAGWSAEDKGAILGGNARELFGLPGGAMP